MNWETGETDAYNSYVEFSLGSKAFPEQVLKPMHIICSDTNTVSCADIYQQANHFPLVRLPWGEKKAMYFNNNNSKNTIFYYYNKMKKEVGMLLQKRTDTSAVGIYKLYEENTH